MTLLFNYDIEENDVERRKEIEEIESSLNRSLLTLDKKEKEDLSEYFKEMLEKIERDDTKLKYYFPENPKSSEKNGYEHSAKKSASILTTQTFG